MSNELKGKISTITITGKLQGGARGKSAYESWLDQGNSGTEAEFVAAMMQDVTYSHNQQIASDTWTITHNLNKYPSVTIVDSSDNVVIGDINYVNQNQIIISFTEVFYGKAYLN
jgi:hypothetical protein